MPQFKFRVDIPTGGFRNVSTVAESEDDAAAVVEAQEEKYARFELDPSQAKDFERRLRRGSLTAADRARIYAHRQEKPYKITRRLV